MGDQRDGNNAPETFVTKEFILSVQNLCGAEVPLIIELFRSLSRLRSK